MQTVPENEIRTAESLVGGVQLGGEGVSSYRRPSMAEGVHAHTAHALRTLCTHLSVLLFILARVVHRRTSNGRGSYL